jgi:hypothetical protein
MADAATTIILSGYVNDLSAATIPVPVPVIYSQAPEGGITGNIPWRNRRATLGVPTKNKINIHD